ncbi:MAG: response regulator [Desulfobacterales bacterium]|nr:response regulator [Desulfobacterales bacterium]
MKRYKILVVEDDKTSLEAWKEVLEDEGYYTDIADNGRIATELWENNIYDLIIVDLRIPEIDGRDLINRFKEEQPLTQVIILSGQGKEGDLIDAINKHVFAYLAKPVDLEKLLEVVAEAIQQRDPVLIALDKLAEKSPDAPVLLVGKKTYSPNQLFNEVRKGTELGKEYHNEFMKTLTDFEPAKETVDELLGIKGIIG